MTPFPTDPYEQFNTFTYRDRYMGYNDFFLKKKKKGRLLVSSCMIITLSTAKTS